MSTAAQTPRSRRAARMAVWCACALAVACSGGEQVDLVSRFDGAEVRVETRRIDVGTEPARRYLTGGWLEHDERWLGREGESFVWSGRWGAEFTFHVFEQRDLPSSARGWPRLVDGEPTVSSFRLLVNDVPVHDVEVEPGAREYRFTLPAQILSVGRNRLLMEYEPGPAGRGGDDRRQFAWDWLEIGRTVVTDLPRREHPGGAHALLVPYLSEVSYDLAPAASSSLRLEVDHFGPPWDDVEPGRLLIRIQDAEGRVAARAEPTLDRRRSLELAVPEAERIRVTFITLPPGSGRTRAERPTNEQIGGAMLIRPRLE